MEEFLAVIVIVFPGILAVNNNRNDMWTFLIFQAGANSFEISDHILGSRLTAHAGIGKTDLVRNVPVSEKDRHFFT